MDQLSVLGHVLSQEGVKMGDDRKSAVIAMPFPKSCYDVCCFLDMGNYMCCFTPKYFSIARPLSSMMNTPPKNWPPENMNPVVANLKLTIQEPFSLVQLDYSKATILFWVVEGTSPIVGQISMLLPAHHVFTVERRPRL